jgi:hypothetical protein
VHVPQRASPTWQVLRIWGLLPTWNASEQNRHETRTCTRIAASSMRSFDAVLSCCRSSSSALRACPPHPPPEVRERAASETKRRAQSLWWCSEVRRESFYASASDNRVSQLRALPVCCVTPLYSHLAARGEQRARDRLGAVVDGEAVLARARRAPRQHGVRQQSTVLVHRRERQVRPHACGAEDGRLRVCTLRRARLLAGVHLVVTVVLAPCSQPRRVSTGRLGALDRKSVV